MIYQELLKINKYFLIFNNLFNNKIVILHESHDLYYIKYNNDFILITESSIELNKISNLKIYLDSCIYFEENLKNNPLQIFSMNDFCEDTNKLNINFIQALQFNFILEKLNKIENNQNINT